MKNEVADYMAVVINGDKDDDGQINFLGFQFCYDYHDECLIHYGKNKYPDMLAFNDIDAINDPNMAIYYLIKKNNIVFTNVTTDQTQKRGMLFLPDEITKKQIKSLYDLSDLLEDFEIFIVYDLIFDDMVIGKCFENDKVLKIGDLITQFLDENNISKKKRGLC